MPIEVEYKFHQKFDYRKQGYNQEDLYLGSNKSKIEESEKKSQAPLEEVMYQMQYDESKFNKTGTKLNSEMRETQREIERQFLIDEVKRELSEAKKLNFTMTEGLTDSNREPIPIEITIKEPNSQALSGLDTPLADDPIKKYTTVDIPEES